MSTILLASFNTAIERLLIAPGFRIGEVTTLEEDHVLAGGKGVNTARILAGLRALGDGLPSAGGRLCGFLGGTTGDLVEAALAEEGLDGAWVRTASRTRVSEVLVDPRDPSRSTVFNGRGEAVTDHESAALDDLFAREISSASGVVCSGSVPPGSPGDAYARWIREANDAGAWSLLDSHGAVVGPAVEAVPTIVKINRDELAALPGSADDLVASWRESGTRAVIITDGSRPTLALTPNGRAEVVPPAVETRSGVGSGDAFTAGLVASLEASGWADWDDALRLASACGAANAMGLRAGLPPSTTPASLRELMARTSVRWS